MELDELGIDMEAQNCLDQIQQESRISADYDPSQGMTGEELHNFCKFLYSQVQSKDEEISRLTANIKELTDEVRLSRLQQQVYNNENMALGATHSQKLDVVLQQLQETKQELADTKRRLETAEALLADANEKNHQLEAERSMPRSVRIWRMRSLSFVLIFTVEVKASSLVVPRKRWQPMMAGMISMGRMLLCQKKTVRGMRLQGRPLMMRSRRSQRTRNLKSLMALRKAKILIFFYEDTVDKYGNRKSGGRNRAVLKDFLGDAKLKSLQSDGYICYMYLDDDLIDIEHLPCPRSFQARACGAYGVQRSLFPHEPGSETL